MSRHRKSYALGAILLVALCLLVFLWLRPLESAVRPDQFDRIRLGMSREDVEAVLGRKAGYMAHEGTAHLTLVTQEGPDMDADRMLSWYGESHSILVWLDDDGRVACRSLTESKWSNTGFVNHVKRRLGLSDNAK